MERRLGFFSFILMIFNVYMLCDGEAQDGIAALF